jgi:hypothetical protein
MAESKIINIIQHNITLQYNICSNKSFMCSSESRNASAVVNSDCRTAWPLSAVLSNFGYCLFHSAVVDNSELMPALLGSVISCEPFNILRTRWRSGGRNVVCECDVSCSENLVPHEYLRKINCLSLLRLHLRLFSAQKFKNYIYINWGHVVA